MYDFKLIAKRCLYQHDDSKMALIMQAIQQHFDISKVKQTAIEHQLLGVIDCDSVLSWYHSANVLYINFLHTNYSQIYAFDISMVTTNE